MSVAESPSSGMGGGGGVAGATIQVANEVNYDYHPQVWMAMKVLFKGDVIL